MKAGAAPFLIELIHARGSRNPFYTRSCWTTSPSHGRRPEDDATEAARGFPESLHSLI